MSKTANSQHHARDKRFSFFTDNETHEIVTSFAKDQGKMISHVVREIVFTNPKVKRFLDKNKQIPTAPVAHS